MYSGVQKSETTMKICDVFCVNLEIIRKSDITRSSLELSDHTGITWAIRFCTNLWSPCQLECMLSLKQKGGFAQTCGVPNTKIF
ncbi:hypothetical protein LDENG_00114580 [Lucifuga dentata]|nr:hypothetical protein LDENG_00114580 [Lucifuga dentata]